MKKKILDPVNLYENGQIPKITVPKVDGSAEAPKSDYSNVLSYEDFLKNSKNNAESVVKKTYTDTVANIEDNRKRGVIDAQASFDFNKATYGDKAEALRGMGLSGSGYSDYLTSRAYATQRAEVQNVNAQAAAATREAESKRDDNLLDIEKSYQENLQLASDNAVSVYNDILAGVKNGTYSYDQAMQLGNDSKLTADQLGSIGAAANEYSKSVQESNYVYYRNLIGTEGFDGAEVVALKDNNGLTSDQYNDLLEYVNAMAADTSAVSNFAVDGKYIPMSEARAKLEAVKNNPMINEDIKTALEKSFNETYDKTTSIVVADTDYIKKTKTGSEGSKVKINANGEEIILKYEKSLNMFTYPEYNALVAAAETVDKFAVFTYKGSYYMKDANGTIWRVTGKNKKHTNKLEGLFK